MTYGTHEVMDVKRIPADDGEWVDLHAARDGSHVWLTTSTGGYVRVEPDSLRAALDAASRAHAR
jgi:hypothetical protein